MLVDRVPDSLVILGARYPIYTDYSTWIKFENLTKDSVKDSEDLLDSIFSLVFKEDLPVFSEEAVDQILWFYKCGKDNESRSEKRKKDIFSYDYDDGFIVAAFKQQYGINLKTEEDLSWWEFHAYMLALSEDTEFVKIMGYRAVEINSKMTAAQKNYYQKMKAHYKLPIKKEMQDEYSQIEEALLNGQPLDGLL